MYYYTFYAEMVIFVHYAVSGQHFCATARPGRAPGAPRVHKEGIFFMDSFLMQRWLTYFNVQVSKQPF